MPLIIFQYLSAFHTILRTTRRVVASLFLHDPIYFLSCSFRSVHTLDVPPPCPSVPSFPSSLPLFLLFFLLILVSFQLTILLSILGKMHCMTFLSCFRVYSLNIVSTCFYLSMHSVALAFLFSFCLSQFPFTITQHRLPSYPSLVLSDSSRRFKFAFAERRDIHLISSGSSLNIT